MAIIYEGRVFWANGAPIQNVEIHLFGPPIGQNLGEKLSLLPGVSDLVGNFTLQIENSQFLNSDLLDELNPFSPQFERIDPQGFSLEDSTRPIIQFTYELKGKRIQTLTSFHRLHRGYYLPFNPIVNFIPSSDGFSFKNSVKPIDPPISLPDWLGVSRISNTYGLCGGMSSAAYDFCLEHVANPNAFDVRSYTDAPKTGTRLHRYLLRRSLDTFGSTGSMVAKVGDWTLRPDQGVDGTQKLTWDESIGIRQSLDYGQLVVITLIYERATEIKDLSKKIWLNHQVLAYKSIPNDQEDIKIRIYDSNFPDRDDIQVQAQRIQLVGPGNAPVFGLVSHEVIPGKPSINVRGFFPMPYKFAHPPKSPR